MTRRTNFWRYFVDQYGDLARDDNLDACLESMRTYKRLVVLELDFERLRRDSSRAPAPTGACTRCSRPRSPSDAASSGGATSP